VRVHEKRHQGKYPKHDVVNHPGYRVSCVEILSEGHASKKADKSEFCNEQKAECNAAHPESCRQQARYREMQDYPSRRNNSNDEHDWGLKQFRHSLAEPLDDVQCSNSPEHEPCPKHETEIEHASFQNLHHRLLPPMYRATCRHPQCRALPGVSLS
jgi:hypothetical protein